jgi:hypothetical protein
VAEELSQLKADAQRLKEAVGFFKLLTEPAQVAQLPPLTCLKELGLMRATRGEVYSYANSLTALTLMRSE